MLYSPLSFAICTVIVYYNPFCNFMKLLYNVVNDIQVIYVYITKKKNNGALTINSTLPYKLIGFKINCSFLCQS